MTIKSNPPWVSRLVHSYCDQINTAAHDLGLPMPQLEGYRCKIIGELGSGHYGSVYKTDQSGIVFKVSSDQTEAHFVATAIKLRPKVDPEGIVKYFAIKALPEKYKGRNVFILWREEADSVGMPGPGWTTDDYEKRSMQEFQKLLMRFKHCAHEAKIIAEKQFKSIGMTAEYWNWITTCLRESVLDEMANVWGATWGEKAPQVIYGADGVGQAILNRYKGNPTLRFSWLVEACHQISIEMVNANQYASLIGGALQDYLDAGILLADVHAQNVGIVNRPEHDNAWVITDPGHALVLRHKLTAPEIQVLK